MYIFNLSNFLPVQRMILQLSLIITSIACTSACQPHTTHTHTTSQPIPQKKLTSSSEIKSQPALPTTFQKLTHKGIVFNIVSFDIRSHHLIIADQPDGPGSKWQNAAAAAKEHDGIAAINAGFFTPEGNPLGIVISNGEKQGSFNNTSLGSGLFYFSKEGHRIARSSAWAALSKTSPTQLLQSGPMLLEQSKPIAGLSDKNPRPRSFISSDGKNHWCIGHADLCTLAQLSNALTSLKIPHFQATTALNLDGGRSSDLWVSGSINAESVQIRPFWNNPVRNFLILKKNK
jgi:uncharacterized protein YigE (DUF2233 family)